MSSDERALAPELALEELAWVRALARKLAVDAHRADDIAQDTLLAAWTSARSGAPPTRAWLMSVARNFLRRGVRDERHRSARELHHARPESLPPADAALAELEAQRRLMTAVAELDEPLRTALVLRYVEDLPPRAIARKLGCTPAQVSHRLTNALRQLRTRLDREGGREGWFGALAPLLALDRGVVNWPLGVALVNSKLIVSCTLVALGAAAWVLWPGASSSDGASEALATPARASVEHTSSSNSSGAALEAPGERSSIAGPSSASTSTPLAPQAAAPSVARIVEGRVFSADAQPLAGIVVGPRESTPRATSGQGGWFQLALQLDSGTLEAFDERWITVGAGEFSSASQATPIVIVAESIELAGLVTDAAGNELRGARLSFARPRDFDARFGIDLQAANELGFRADSDAEGRFRFTRAPAIAGGRLRVALDGYEPLELPAPVASTIDLLVVLARPKVAPQGRLAGVVLTPERRPASKARVALGLTSAVCDDEGRFELDLARAVTTAELRAVKEGYLPAIVARPYEPRGDSGWPEHLEVVLPGNALTLGGVVLDHERRPVAGARVSLADPTSFGVIGRMPATAEGLAAGAPVPPEAIASQREMPDSDGERFWDYYARPGPPSVLWNWVRTDSEGRFELGGLLDRAYRIKVQIDESLETFVSDPLDARDGAVEVVMPRPQRWEVLSGVLVGPDDAPVASAQLQLEVEAFGVRSRVFGGSVYVTMRQNGARTVTDEKGRFEFRDVARGDLRVMVRGDGLVPSEHELGQVPDPLGVRLVADTRCSFELELLPPTDRADALAALDGAGQPLDLLRIRGGSINAYTDIELVGGRSGVQSVSSRARTLVLTKEGREIGRIPVRLTGAEPVMLRW